MNLQIERISHPCPRLQGEVFSPEEAAGRQKAFDMARKMAADKGIRVRFRVRWLLIKVIRWSFDGCLSSHDDPDRYWNFREMVQRLGERGARPFESIQLRDGHATSN